MLHDDGSECFDGGGELDFDVDVPLNEAGPVARLAAVRPAVLAQHAMDVHARPDPGSPANRQGSVAWNGKGG